MSESVLLKAAGETAQEAPKRRQRPKPVELDTPFSFDNPTPVREAIVDVYQEPNPEFN